jgi:hypothetical protein
MKRPCQISKIFAIVRLPAKRQTTKRGKEIKILDGSEKRFHTLISLLLKSESHDLAARKTKKSCKNKYLGEKVKVNKLDADRKKLHNLVSLLLTNTTLCWAANYLG